MASYPIEKKPLHVPSLEDAAKSISKGLSANFEISSCEVVQCPDLTQDPWGLASAGLSGSPRIAEAGGVYFLLPFAKKDKIYDFKELAKNVELPGAFVIGAGAGPHKHVGVNCEMVTNLSTGSDDRNFSRVAKVGDNGDCVLSTLPKDETTCAILVNFFACKGERGPVIKVKAKKRTGKDDFVGCMRKSLEETYGDEPVGFGGVFRLAAGTAKIHIMPDFSESPLKSEADVNKWLKFYDMKAPMTFMSVAVSRDPGLEFRLEHSHGYGKEDGGHYHFDTTPDEVEYEGYFNLADFIYRIDRPAKPGQPS